MAPTKSKFWTLAPEYQKPDDPLLFDEEGVVSRFVEATYYWYEDKENSLFGWEDRVKKELIRCLKEDDGPPSNSPYQLSYAFDKFMNEWIESRNPVFIEATQEPAYNRLLNMLQKEKGCGPATELFKEIEEENGSDATN